MPRQVRALLLTMTLCGTTAAAQAPADWQPPPPTPGAISPRSAPYHQDTVEFTLAPNEGMEYKYRLEHGAAFLYSWTASAPLHFEMHSVPDGAPSSFAETFEKRDDSLSAHGSYHAPFTGIHGWYWQNRTERPVTLKMTTAGFYTASEEFRRGVPPKRRTF